MARRRSFTKALETDPGLEFELFLCRQLGKTLGELRAGIGQVELAAWQVYYARKAQREEMAVKKASKQTSMGIG